MFWRNLALVVLLAALSYRLTGQYAVHRLRRLREEVVCVLKGTALLTLLVVAVIFCLRDPYESRPTLFLFAPLTAAGVLATRRASWAAIRHLRSRGYNQTFAVIVGTGRVARKTARALRNASWMGIKTIGFVEDHPSDWANDLDILGTTADLPALLQKYGIGHVFIALPMSRYHDARRVYDVLSQSVVEVRLVADVPNLSGLSLATAH